MLCTSCTQTSSRNTLSPLSLRLRCLVGKCKSSFWKTMKERNQTRRQISYLSLIIDDNLGQNSWESYTFTPRQHSCAPPTPAPNQCFFFLRLIRVDQGNGTFANSRTSIELGEGEVRLETHFEFEMGYFVKLIWWAIKRLSNFVFLYEGKDRKLQIGKS